MVSGLPGNMASLIAGEIIPQEDMVLSHVGLSHTRRETILVTADPQHGSECHGVSLFPEAEHMKAIITEEPDMVVDFTTGSSVKNCQLYCDLSIPFVMGSTGADRAKMESMVAQSNISAVIAPNMASPVVVIQAMLEYAAQNFSGALSGYSLKIAESHQAGKKDISGTARAFEKLLNVMGAVSDEDGILSVRDPFVQKRLCGISPEYLGGHGHHEYVFVSGDKTVHLALVHNIDGRRVYVDGTIKAIRFLAYKLGVPGKVFSMVDVLKNS